MKRINRKKFLEFVMIKTETKNITQQLFCGKNIYFLTASNKEDIEYQIEFLSQSERFFYTVRIMGLRKESDFLHSCIVKYLKELKLDRNIIVDTENKQTLI